ncbi:MAG: GNAT family N-acetyltransferase [Saccharofermentans sp.]|nr:GNAT family N-acetyltransferase [Saccharofermentans sp.]
MDISFRWTNGSDKAFHDFYLKTEEFYSSIVGGRKNREAFIPYNISESIADVLIAESDGIAVGCGGLKMYSRNAIEIKRLWVDKEYRGNHIATEIMERLEDRAEREGCTRLILQTRPSMEEAISLYTKRGYKQIDNYPPYDKLEGAICFEKRI